MGYFFFDDSVHPRGGFVLGAWVYVEDDPQERIADLLTAAGLEPGRDEFKSGAHMGRDPRQPAARAGLKAMIAHGTRVGVVVVPSENRELVGSGALEALRSFLEANSLGAGPHHVYLDRGLFPSVAKGREQVAVLGLEPACEVHVEADSRLVFGLQLADLVAHSASVMLLETLGVVNKTVKAGDNSGYDPDLDIEIGFELWAGLRYHFFGGAVPDPDTWTDQVRDAVYPIEPYGLYVSPLCGAALADAARERFAFMYVGCIH